MKMNEGHQEDGGHEGEVEVCVMEEALEEPDLKLKIKKGHEEEGGGHEDEEEVCVMEEDLEEPDPKLKINEKLQEDGGGHEDEEEVFEGGNDTEEEEEDDDHTEEEWGEDDKLYHPYVGYSDPPVLRCIGGSYTIEEAEKIAESVDERNYKLSSEWCDLFNNNKKPLPLPPLIVLPKITRACAAGYECYHLRHWTEITSENHPYFIPCGMMQVFSLKLSSPLAHPVNIYWTFAVRDCWEPLRNHLTLKS